MSRFLEANYNLKYLISDDIIEIIRRIQDEQNKHKAMFKYYISTI